MPKHVCRLRWQRGQALGLVKYTSPTFFDLPREIRDRIYDNTLILQDPIIVSSTEHNVSTSQSKDKKFIFSESVTLDLTYPILAPHIVAILYCNRQIATEASAVFYGSNVFQFIGDETWQPMSQWLAMIGSNNRAYLRNLEAEVRVPQFLVQDQYTRRRHYNMISPFPWQLITVDSCCETSTGHFPWTIVDHVSRGIEACFRMLGNGGNPLTLRLMLPYCCIPGIKYPWENLEVPEAVERFRREFANGRINVIWSGEVDGSQSDFSKQRAAIEARGWHLVSVEPKYRLNSGGTEMPYVLFSIRTG